MRVDSHHHFWNYSANEYGWIDDQMRLLRRDFSVDDLLLEIGPTKIDAVISVQARQSITETEWLLNIAEKNDCVVGVVGWIPLASPGGHAAIERWARSSYLKAVRHVVQDEPSDAFILGEDFNRGIDYLNSYNLVYDILIYGRQLTNTIAFVDRHPSQQFVLDHIAKPTILAAEFDVEWEKNLRDLARRENVACKFSGVLTEVRDVAWDMDTIRPYWNVVLEAFGSQRLMYGSDWPVCLLKSKYAEWVDVVGELSSELSEHEKRDFWGQNACRIYSL